MPIPDKKLDEITTYSPAPSEVSNYLHSRGWVATSYPSNCWQHYGLPIQGQDFDWPEALAYEMFRTFVLLKTPDEK